MGLNFSGQVKKKGGCRKIAIGSGIGEPRRNPSTVRGIKGL